MCWIVNIHVVLQNDVPANRRLVVSPPADTSFRCIGAFPDYQVTGGGCGCGTVAERNGAALEPKTVACVRHFLSIEQVKRVEIRWWWGGTDHPPGIRETRRVSPQEFEALNARRELGTEVNYRITDFTKFHHRPARPRPRRIAL